MLFNVYPAGEMPIAGADSRSLCEGVTTRDGNHPMLIDNRESVAARLPAVVGDKDIILIMGAGDIGSLGPELISRYSQVSG